MRRNSVIWRCRAAMVAEPAIGLYRQNAIAIQDEVGDSNGGNV